MHYATATAQHNETLVPNAVSVKVNNVSHEARLYVMNRNVMRVNASNCAKSTYLSVALFVLGSALSLLSLYNELTLWSIMSSRTQNLSVIAGTFLLALWSCLALTTAYYYDAVKLGKNQEFVERLSERELSRLSRTQLRNEGRVSLAVSKEQKKRERVFNDSVLRKANV